MKTLPQNIKVGDVIQIRGGAATDDFEEFEAKVLAIHYDKSERMWLFWLQERPGACTFDIGRLGNDFVEVVNQSEKIYE